MNRNIEVEGGELLLESKEGHYAIIPSKDREKVMGMLNSNCNDCINEYISSLPRESDYAEDGSLYSEFLDTGGDDDDEMFSGGSLPEVDVKAEAPDWLKYRRDYVRSNPFSIDEYVENRYNNPVGREAIKKIDRQGWREELRREGLEKRYNQAMDYTSEQLVKNKPQGKMSRSEWLNTLSDKEEGIIKRNPKYQTSLWDDTKRGLISSTETFPQESIRNIVASKDFSTREKRELIKQYADSPMMSKIGDAAKILSPLSVGSKAIQAAYRDDTTLSGALKGQKNKAGVVEDMVTDPLNLTGVGLGAKIAKGASLFKGAKRGSVANKIDDVGKGLKFDDFKNDDEFFRIIVGQESMDDIVKSGQIRVKRPSSYKTETNAINLDRRGTTSSPSFSKGKPSLEYAQNNPEHFIIKTSEPLKPSTMGRHGKGSTMFPTDEAGKHLSSLDASKTQIYKHTGNGNYELVNIKPIASSVDDVSKRFKSEIDWSKWNKEIPDNPLLVKEYNAIEQTSKANNTWMKNPDGSKFTGTPEQFVQQNSENFKKAFPDGFNNVYRGVNPGRNLVQDLHPERGVFTANEELASKYAKKGSSTLTPNNAFNKSRESEHNPKAVGGIFNLAHRKSKNSLELNFNEEDWAYLPLKDKSDLISEYSKRVENYLKEVKDIKLNEPDLYSTLVGRIERNISTMREKLSAYKNMAKNDPLVLEEMRKVLGSNATTDDIAAYMEKYNIDYAKLNNIHDGGMGDVTIVNHKKGNYLKSLVGNSGMFDMTNPNVYKALVPTTVAGAVIQNETQNDKK